MKLGESVRCEIFHVNTEIFTWWSCVKIICYKQKLC